MIKNVTFFGSSEVKPGSPDYDAAYQTAKLLAQDGFQIVNGGGPGVMRASSEGAKAGGGRAAGVSFNPKDMTHFEGRDPQNPLDQEIIVDDYVLRTLKLLELGDAYLLFNGGTGTISEFGMAWGLARLYFGHHKPLILYGAFWHEILEAFGRNMLIRPEEVRVYRIVTTPQEVLTEIRKL
ncbi:MAG TPA: LOG family protein [Patescibacteria group bacterium]|nr:LOG family protein [Patescibacteria group bacterium]